MKLAVVGNVNADLLVWPVEELPPPGADQLVESMEIRAAGGAGNTALALAALGRPPLLAGCVGEDHFGKFILESLSAAGVATDHVTIVPKARTGISIAFEAPGRDRSFLTFSGSLERFNLSMVPMEEIRSSDLLLLCGYFNLTELRGRPARQLLLEARSAGSLTLFDSDWDLHGWTREARKEVADLLPLVDIFLPNADEARMLTGLSDQEAAACRLQRISGGWVVVKLGRDGCLAVGPTGKHRVPAPKTRARDTTGAGDAFNGGLMFALSSGIGWKDSLRFATRLASEVVSRPSHDRYPSAEEVDK